MTCSRSQSKYKQCKDASLGKLTSGTVVLVTREGFHGTGIYHLILGMEGQRESFAFPPKGLITVRDPNYVCIIDHESSANENLHYPQFLRRTSQFAMFEFNPAEQMVAADMKSEHPIQCPGGGEVVKRNNGCRGNVLRIKSDPAGIGMSSPSSRHTSHIPYILWICKCCFQLMTSDVLRAS